MNAIQPRIDAVHGCGRQARTLVSGEETGGRLALVELLAVAGQEPPRHVHDIEDETIYVLAGELTFFVGDRVVPVSAGACLFLPRGVEHGYAVESGEARLVVVCTPAGIEGYYQEADGLDGEERVERLISIAARYGIAITGPAPTCRPPGSS